MQIIKHTTIIITAFCSALAMLAGACEDDRSAGRDISLYENSAEGISQQALWTVSIQRMGPDALHWCSGALIADTWVLTAAHCVEDKPAASLQVVAGLGETAPEPLLRDVEKVVSHPSYARLRLGYAHDLALLRLSVPLDVSGAEVAAIELGTAADLEPTSSGVMGLVSGKVPVSSGEDSDALQVVSVALLSNAEVRATFRTPIDSEQIASEPMEGTPCQADGGSPLVLDTLDGPRLVGVASEGTGCAEPSSPQIYARVSSYLEWIDTEMRGS